MIRVVVLAILLCAVPFGASAAAADTLNLNIRLSKGERGRDSSSKSTLITITDNAIVYKVTYGGRNRGRMPEQNKEFKLETDDQKRLIGLIKAGNLLVTESIEYPEKESGQSYYFSFSLGSEVNKKKGLITVKGPRNAPDIKESKLYKNASALFEAVFEILHRMDKEIDYEPLVR